MLTAALALPLLLATQTTPSTAETPTADAPAPTTTTEAPTTEAPTTEAPTTTTTTTCVGPTDLDRRYARADAVLAAFAAQGQERRISTGVTASVIGAGLIGGAITYVAVSYVDTQLSTKDAEDTRIGGYVLGGAAVVPAAVLVTQIAFASREEERHAVFTGATTAEEKEARLSALSTNLANESRVVEGVVGVSSIAGGLGAAGLGAFFLLLPHLHEFERGPMTHATGAELIGAGVAAAGLGTVLVVDAATSTPPAAALFE